jgi:hypothetical protein
MARKKAMSTTPIDRSQCKGSRHGDYSAYRLGCRCPDARNDDRIYRKRRREGRHPARMIDATGTARRLQALAAIGWSTTELGPHLDAHPNLVQRWRSGNRPVNRANAIKVAALYRELQGTPGPSDVTRARAQSFGWVPPHLWEDVDIDDPNARPEEAAPAPGRRSVAVLVENFDDLVSKGLSEAQAAAQLGILPESIGQARKRVEARKAQTAARKEEAA